MIINPCVEPYYSMHPSHNFHEGRITTSSRAACTCAEHRNVSLLLCRWLWSRLAGQ